MNNIYQYKYLLVVNSLFQSFSNFYEHIFESCDGDAKTAYAQYILLFYNNERSTIKKLAIDTLPISSNQK